MLVQVRREKGEVQRRHPGCSRSELWSCGADLPQVCYVICVPLPVERWRACSKSVSLQLVAYRRVGNPDCAICHQLQAHKSLRSATSSTSVMYVFESQSGLVCSCIVAELHPQVRHLMAESSVRPGSATSSSCPRHHSMHTSAPLPASNEQQIQLLHEKTRNSSQSAFAIGGKFRGLRYELTLRC